MENYGIVEIESSDLVNINGGIVINVLILKICIAIAEALQ